MIILILGLSLFVRLINLNQSFWLDEAITALAVKNFSLVDLITIYSPQDFHPPLYYLILKIWSNYFGLSEIALRLPSVIFGVLTTFFVYLIGKKLWGVKVGLIASILFALNPLSVYYSQETRMYAFVAFAVCAAFYFFLKKNWIMYGLFFLLALYSDYLPYLMFPVFFLISQNKKQFIIHHLLLVIFLIPLFFLFYQQLSLGLSVASAHPAWQQVVGGFSLKALPLTFVKFIIGRVSIDDKLLYALIMVPTSIIYFYTLIRARERNIWAWLTVPIVLGYFGSILLPIFSYFRFLFVIPSLSLLLAKGAHKNIVLLVTIILVSCFSILFFNINPRFAREDWRSVATYTSSDPGLIVMPSVAQSASFKYYSSDKVVDLEQLDDELNNKIDNNLRTIYLLRYVQEIFDPNDNQKKLIESAQFEKVEEKSFNGGLLVWKYQK